MGIHSSSDTETTAEATKQGRLPLPSIRRRKNYHWFVVGTVCIGAFMAALDASIVNIALPTLQNTFRVTLSEIEWVSLAYLLTLAAMIVPLGRLADMLGRRWMYAIGFSVFIIGSFLCGIAPSLTFMLTSRVFQAIGAAMLQANSVAIITAATPSSARGKAIGIQGSAQAVGLSLGPAVGGALLSLLSWRWIFFVNVPVGIIGTTLGILLLPRDDARKRREPFDIIGAALLAPTLVAFIYFLNTGHQDGWLSPMILASYGVTIVGLGLFLLREKRSKFPMVDLSLFRNPAFSIGNITGVLSFAVMYAITLLGPFYLDHVTHLPPYQAGLLLMVIPLGMTLFTPVSGALADRYGPRLLTMSGMGAALLGAVALGFGAPEVRTGVGYLLLIIGFFLVGMGLGVFTPPNNSTVMGNSPKERLGVAGGILNMSRTLGMGMGVTLGGLSYQIFLMIRGAVVETTATTAQMVPAFQDAFLFVGAIALVAMLLSAIKKSAG